jgi:hypothetical protein
MAQRSARKLASVDVLSVGASVDKQLGLSTWHGAEELMREILRDVDVVHHSCCG